MICLAGKVACSTMLSSSSIEDYLGLSVGFISMSCHSVILWPSLMDQPDKGFSGTVGELFFSKVETLQRNTEFEPIPLLETLVDISEDIASKLSTDSVVAWKYLHAVVKGKLDPEVAALKCGQLSRSRWLICNMRCLLLYMSKHDLGPEDMEVLKLLAT